MGHLAERNRDVKVIHKLPGRKPEIFLGERSLAPKIV